MKILLNRVLLSVTLCLFVSSVFAQDNFPPIRFDFTGPDVPAEWKPGVYPGGTREIMDASYVISAPNDFGAASSDISFEHENLIVDTQIRFLPGGVREDFASVLLRSNDGTPDGYFGGVNSNGDLLMSRVTASTNVDPTFRVTASGYDAVDQDLRLRLVAAGPTISMYAWPASGEMPSAPTLSLTDTENLYSSGDEISLLSSSFQTGNSWPIAFRYVELSPVPEPNSGWLAGIGVWMSLTIMRKNGSPPRRTSGRRKWKNSGNSPKETGAERLSGKI